MADFTDTSITEISAGAAQTQPVPPARDVQVPDQSAQLASGLIQSLGQQATNLIGAFESIENQGAISEFSQRQLLLADAVDQGRMSSGEARMRMRANFTEAIANNPTAQSDLFDVQKNIMTTSGLGKVVAEGTEEEKRHEALVSDAFDAGFIMPDGSNEVSGLENYIKWKAATNRLDLISKQISTKQAATNLERSKNKRESEQVLQDLADPYFSRTVDKADSLRKQFENGEVAVEEAIQEIDREIQLINQTINAAGRNAGSEFISSVTSPMVGVLENLKSYVTGDTTKKVLDNRLNNLIARQELQLVTSDPEIKNFVATTNLLGDAAGILADIQGGEIVARMLSQNSVSADDEENDPANPLPKTSSRQQTQGEYFNVIKNSIKTLTGSASENVDDPVALEQEVNTQLSNVLSGIDVYGQSVTDPKAYRQVVDFLASPEFGTYVRSQEGRLPQTVAEKAGQVLEQQYGRAALPLIKNEYNNADTLLGKELKNAGTPFVTAETREGTVPSVIEPVFEGGGVRFKLREGVDVDPNFSVAPQAKLRELNKQDGIAGIMNRVIRMTAHLEGHNDYKKVWEDKFMPEFVTDTEGDTASPR